MRTKKRYYQYIRSQLDAGRLHRVFITKKSHRVVTHYIRQIHDAHSRSMSYYQHHCYSRSGFLHCYHKAGLHNYSTHKYCTQK